MNLFKILKIALSNTLMSDDKRFTKEQTEEGAISFIKNIELDSHTSTENDILNSKYYNLINEIHHFIEDLQCDDTFFWLADNNGRFFDFKNATNSLLKESSKPIYRKIVNDIINNFDLIQEYPVEELLFYRLPMENKEFLNKMILNAYNKGELYWKNEFQHIPKREKKKRIEYLEKISETIPELKSKAQCFAIYLYTILNNEEAYLYNPVNLYELVEKELIMGGIINECEANKKDNSLELISAGTILQVLESISLIETSANIETLINRYDFLVDKLQSIYETYKNDEVEYSLVRTQAMTMYEQRYYDKQISDYMEVIIKQPEVDLKEFYSKNIIRCLYAFSDKMEREINSLKTEKAKKRRQENIIECVTICVTELNQKGNPEYLFQIPELISRFNIKANVVKQSELKANGEEIPTKDVRIVNNKLNS